MILLTTFSPTNIENQQNALKSWINLGYSVISFNSKNDINQLKQHFEIEFIETDNLGTEFGKDYVKLNVFTEWIKNNESALLINSDIEILKNIEINDVWCEIQVFQRHDYKEHHKINKRFESGFDAFYLTKQFCNEFPKTELLIGQCHWDYLIPMIALKKCYKIKSPNSAIIYHKEHKLQYDTTKWKQTAKIFASELKLTGNPYTDSSMTHKHIKRNIIYY